jgi:RecB family exonuclease
MINLTLDEYVSNLVGMLNTVLDYNREFLKTGPSETKEFFDHLNALAKLRIYEAAIESGTKTLQFILGVMKDGTYNLRGDPFKGVQVIGFLEARNLDFDCVVLPSMNEGVFPKYSEKDLFISQPVRKEIGLPYDKERENLYYYYFTEMTRGKKEVFISYVVEEKREVRSRFIDFLSEQGIAIDESKIPLERGSIKVPKRNVKKNREIISSLYNKVAGKGLTPTGLRDYKECPYRFYLKYLLNIREPKETAEKAGPLEWGNIIHKALNNFYRFNFPTGFTEKDLDRAISVLHGRLNTALNRELAQEPHKVVFLDLEIYKKRLEKFLRNELKRFEMGYRIDKKRLENISDYKMQVTGKQIRLYGYPDRVDRYNGKYYVIDYKSTIPQKKKYQIGEGFVEFQLPLYALIVSEEDFDKVCGMAYYGISTKITIVEIKNIARYLNDFRGILLSTITELLDPSISFYQTDDRERCRYCAYTHLCGVKYV